MKVKQLMAILEGFDPQADVHLCISLPGRVPEIFEQVWVGDSGGAPQINAALDPRGFCIYVGITIPQRLRTSLAESVDLGHYEDPADAARVHDFYVLNKRLEEPLNFPNFDYERWIPPRTVSGQYNEHVARILREKLLRD